MPSGTHPTRTKYSCQGANCLRSYRKCRVVTRNSSDGPNSISNNLSVDSALDIPALGNLKLQNSLSSSMYPYRMFIPNQVFCFICSITDPSAIPSTRPLQKMFQMFFQLLHIFQQQICLCIFFIHYKHTYLNSSSIPAESSGRMNCTIGTSLSSTSSYSKR